MIAEIVSSRSGSRAPIELAKALRRRGHEVRFFAFDHHREEETEADLTHAGIEVILFRRRKVPLLGRFLAGVALWRQLRQRRPDVLEIQPLMSFGLAAGLSGIPVVSTYFGSQFSVLREHRFPDYGALWRLFDLLLNPIVWLKTFLTSILPATRVVAISDACRRELKRLYGWETEVIPWGARPTSFPALPRSKRSEGELRVLSVSRITPYKNFHLLLPVVQRLRQRLGRPIRFTIAGSSPQPRYLNFLRSMAEREDEILLDLTDEALARLYGETNLYLTADMYLFFGLPLLEAASAGVPAVALDRFAARELIAHGETGFVARTLEELERFTEALLRSTEKRRAFGASAKARAEQSFTWERAAAGYERALRLAMEKKRS